MGWARTLYWLLPRRLRSYWPLLAIASFGILAAVTLMAVGAVYSRGLAEGGVRHFLSTTDPTVLDAQIIVQNRPLGLRDYQKLRTSVEQVVQKNLSHMLRETQRFGRTPDDWALITGAGGPRPLLGAPVGRPFFLTGFQEHSRLVEGRWPSANLEAGQGFLELETVIGAETARSMGWRLGTQVSLFPFRGDALERVVLTVVGLADAIDPQEEYWLGSVTYFSAQSMGEQLLIPFYLTEDSFFQGLGGKYPAVVGNFGWYLYLDISVVTASTVDGTIDSIAALEIAVNKNFPRSLVLTGLDNTLTRYKRELTMARVPIFLYMGLVVLLILYFLALVMGFLSRYRAEEAGLLRSRGGSIAQVGGILVASEGVVTLFSVIVGPFLALAIVRYLLLRTIDPVGVDGTVNVGISADMFVMGAIGGLLSLLVLAGYGVNRARLGVAGALRDRARPPSVPLLHRYYVDLLVLAALGLLWWQISGRGGFVSRELASGALEVNPSLLFGPILVLLAAAFLMLRFLPFLVRLLAWGSSRVSPAWASFTLVRLARDPLPHGSLVIILMLAAALGVFGASFQSTLARSQKEQALFRQGGDLVVGSRRFTPAVQAAVAAAPGVEHLTAVAKDTVTLLDVLPRESATLISFDPAALAQTAWFRDDFAGQSLKELLGPLGEEANAGPISALDPALGIPIPADGEHLGVWVNVKDLESGPIHQGLNLWARLRDDQGRHRNILLGDVFESSEAANLANSASRKESPNDPTSLAADRGEESNASGNFGRGTGWIYLEGSIYGSVNPAPNPSSRPSLGLVSFYITKRSLSAIPPGSIILDEVTVRGSSLEEAGPGAGTIIEGFDEPGPRSRVKWKALANQAVEPDILEYGPAAGLRGGSGLRFTWASPLVESNRGILLPAGHHILPAVGSLHFQPGQVVRLRDSKHVVPVVIRNVSRFFPTARTSAPFLLVDRDDYVEYVNRLPQGTIDQPRQLWVSPTEGWERQNVISSIIDAVPGFAWVRDRDRAVSLAGRNPLAGGAWNGLTVLAVSAIIVAVLLTLAIHSVVSVHTGRVDLSVVRALGFSRAQMIFSLTLERFLVAGLGIGAGSAIGVWLGRWVLGYLDIAATGQQVIPPMIVDMKGWLVALILASLIAATLLSLFLAVFWVRRMQIPQVLRAAE